jgi:hypothetical protein
MTDQYYRSIADLRTRTHNKRQMRLRWAGNLDPQCIVSEPWSPVYFLKMD